MKKGSVTHSKVIENNVQTDTLKISVPFSAINEEGLRLLGYWYVGEFYCGFVDWNKEEIVCTYETTHSLPNGNKDMG